MSAFDPNIARLMSLYDATNAPVFLKNSELLLVYTNSAYEKLLGFDATKVLGTDGAKIYDQKSLEKIKSFDRMVLESDREHSHPINIKLHDDSRVAAVLSKKKIKYGGSFYIRGMVSGINDIDPANASVDWQEERSRWQLDG